MRAVIRTTARTATAALTGAAPTTGWSGPRSKPPQTDPWQRLEIRAIEAREDPQTEYQCAIQCLTDLSAIFKRHDIRMSVTLDEITQKKKPKPKPKQEPSGHLEQGSLWKE